MSNRPPPPNPKPVEPIAELGKKIDRDPRVKAALAAALAKRRPKPSWPD